MTQLRRVARSRVYAPRLVSSRKLRPHQALAVDCPEFLCGALAGERCWDRSSLGDRQKTPLLVHRERADAWRDWTPPDPWANG